MDSASTWRATPTTRTRPQAYGGNASDASSRPSNWAHGPSSSQPAYLHGVHGQQWGSEDYVVTEQEPAERAAVQRPAPGLERPAVRRERLRRARRAGEWYYDRTGIGRHGRHPLLLSAGRGRSHQGGFVHPRDGVPSNASSSSTGAAARAPRARSGRGRRFAVLHGDQRVRVDAARGSGSPSTDSTTSDTLRTFPSCNEQILRSDWQNLPRRQPSSSRAASTSPSRTASSTRSAEPVSSSTGTTTASPSLATSSSARDPAPSCSWGATRRSRNPMFGYGAGSPVGQLDMTPGPQTNDYPSQLQRHGKSDSRHRRPRAAGGGGRHRHGRQHHGQPQQHLQHAARRASTSGTDAGAATRSRTTTCSPPCSSPGITARTTAGGATATGTPAPASHRVPGRQPAEQPAAPRRGQADHDGPQPLALRPGLGRRPRRRVDQLQVHEQRFPVGRPQVARGLLPRR